MVNGSPRDDGLFGPGSVTWRVHASPAMLIGGLRALLIQTLHPLAMAGVAQHSDYRAAWRPLSRYLDVPEAEDANVARLRAIVAERPFTSPSNLAHAGVA